MLLTKAGADFELVDRCGGVLTFCNRSVAADGTNPNTVGPLREGLRSIGVSPAAFGAMTDADLSTLTDAQIVQVLDIAELRLSRNALGWLTKVDQAAGQDSQRLGQVRTDLKDTIKDLEDRCKQLYGYGLGSVQAGVVDLGFASTLPNQTEPLYDFGGEGF